MSESPSARQDDVPSSAQEAIESSPEIVEDVADISEDLQEKSEEKTDQLKDSLIDSPTAKKPASIEQPEEEAKHDVPIEALESLSIADKSPTDEPLKSEERGRQTKPKSETPSKSRSRARSIADVLESPYNTRLKVKLMKEREQRSVSEDSGKRDAKQTI